MSVRLLSERNIKILSTTINSDKRRNRLRSKNQHKWFIQEDMQMKPVRIRGRRKRKRKSEKSAPTLIK
jgi:hypothetical protein